MTALLLAILLALLLDQGTASQRMIARFGDGPDGIPSGAMIGLPLVIAGNAIVAATLGAMVAALLMPNARLLFLALSLLMGGGGQLFAGLRTLSQAQDQDKALRASLPALAGIAMRRAGENGAFAIAGVAAFTDAPVLTAVGAMLGGWAAIVPPLTLGSAAMRHGAMRVVLLVFGLILLAAGIAAAAGSLRLL